MAESGGDEPYVVFRLEGLRYALVSSQVREVVQAVAVRPLPRSGDIVEGIFNYRGQLVPLLDIRRRFALAKSKLHPAQQFIIADANGRLIAIRVDGSDGLAEIPEVQIEDARQAVPNAEYVAGVAKLADGLILIHDLSTFLSACEAADLAERLAAAEASQGPAP